MVQRLTFDFLDSGSLLNIKTLVSGSPGVVIHNKIKKNYSEKIVKSKQSRVRFSSGSSDDSLDNFNDQVFSSNSSKNFEVQQELSSMSRASLQLQPEGSTRLHMKESKI